MKYRAAKVADAPFITELLIEFHGKMLTPMGIPYDRMSVISHVLRTIELGICLVGPTSCAGAFINPFPWNKGVLMATVSFWYFKAPREITIFKALMEECRRAGATHLTASSQFPDNAIGRHYQKLALQPRELVHLSAL